MDSKWYMNETILRAAVEEYGTIEAAAIAIGGAHPTTVQKAWRAMGLEKRPRGPIPKGTVNREALAALHKKVYG
jgi:hypothetical protein